MMYFLKTLHKQRKRLYVWFIASILLMMIVTMTCSDYSILDGISFGYITCLAVLFVLMVIHTVIGWALWLMEGYVEILERHGHKWFWARDEWVPPRLLRKYFE